MAKLSIGGAPSFEGNAARKMPSRQTEQDDVEPVTQRMPGKAAEEDHEEDEITGERVAFTTERTAPSTPREKRDIKQALDFEDAERQEQAARLRKSISKMKGREAPKMGKTLEKQREEGDVAFSEKRKMEGLTEAFSESLQKRRSASIEEARQLLPHGDRVFELIADTIQENPARGIQIAIEVDKDQLFSGQKFDLATEYVRVLAKYRKAVDSGDDDIRTQALAQLTRFNRTLGIPLNAAIEENLEQEDLGYAREQMKIDQAHFAANELAKDAKDVEGIPMDVDRVKKDNLIKRPADLWDNIASMLPKGQENLATEYVLTLARVNGASRAVDVAAYDKANAALEKMSATLGIQGRADILSETLPRPGEKYENPFGA